MSQDLWVQNEQRTFQCKLSPTELHTILDESSRTDEINLREDYLIIYANISVLTTVVLYALNTTIIIISRLGKQPFG